MGGADGQEATLPLPNRLKGVGPRGQGTVVPLAPHAGKGWGPSHTGQGVALRL